MGILEVTRDLVVTMIEEGHFDLEASLEERTKEISKTFSTFYNTLQDVVEDEF